MNIEARTTEGTEKTLHGRATGEEGLASSAEIWPVTVTEGHGKGSQGYSKCNEAGLQRSDHPFLVLGANAQR